MNAKDWIKELQSNPDWTTAEIDWEAVDEIEKAVKVLEIIKEKRFNRYFLGLIDMTCEKYNERMDMLGLPSRSFHLTEEEFDLLKEELK